MFALLAWVIGRYRLHGNCLAFRYAYRHVFAHATSEKTNHPAQEKRCSNPSRVRSFFRGIGHQTKQGKSEVINQRKTGQGLCSKGLKNSCKKKGKITVKKGYFYLTNALNCGIIYIALIGEGRKPYTIKKEARGNPLKFNPPQNYMDNQARKASQAAYCVRKSTCTPNVSSGADLTSRPLLIYTLIESGLQRRFSMNWKSTNDIAFAIATETNPSGEYGKGV